MPLPGRIGVVSRARPPKRRGDRRPGAGRVDDEPRRQLTAFARQAIAVTDTVDAAVVAPQDLRARWCARSSSAPRSTASTRVGDAEPGAVDAPLVEGDAAEDAADEPGLEFAQLVTVQPDVRLTVFERLIAIVDAEERVVGRELDAGGEATAENRHQERDAEQQVRRDVLDVPRVEARAVGDVGVVRQVARAAVDHPARVAAGAEGDVVALEQGRRQAAQSASRRTPVPFTPPPMTITSRSSPRPEASRSRRAPGSLFARAFIPRLE